VVGRDGGSDGDLGGQGGRENVQPAIAVGGVTRPPILLLQPPVSGIWQLVIVCQKDFKKVRLPCLTLYRSKTAVDD